MKRYLQISYYTLSGIKRIIDLGDFCYGEWIVYNSGNPAYHIMAFDKSSSNMMINSLLKDRQLSIEEILKRINKQHSTNLSLGGWGPVGIKKKVEHIELNLGPLPESWLENI